MLQIALVVLVLPDILEGRRDIAILLPLVPATFGTILILLDGLALNPFGITTAGVFPPRRPLSKLFSNDDWFVPFDEIRKIEMWEGAPPAKVTGHAFGFRIELRGGRKIKVSPIGGFGALSRYVKSEDEMMTAHNVLSVAMEELNRPETRLLASRGEEIVIPKERFSVKSR